MNEPISINIGTDFSRYPVGRYRKDGEFNGEVFRDDRLTPHLAMGRQVRLLFDDALGYGSSFLEEVFGGLVRSGYTPAKLRDLLILESSDDSLITEIFSYIDEAKA